MRSEVDVWYIIIVAVSSSSSFLFLLKKKKGVVWVLVYLFLKEGGVGSVITNSSVRGDELGEGRRRMMIIG